VVVDLRQGSPDFGRWHGQTLDATEGEQLWIPPGFAHGFLALAEDTHVLYKTTDVYAPACERVLRWDDPALGIRWPLATVLADGQAPALAPRDASAPGLDALSPDDLPA
jgi:dTDP-4-dehydrorhamnose 3,5-epimerase